MAGANKMNKQLPAKILLRSKYLSDWTASSYVLESGEVGICVVPADTSLGETQPTYLMKVGDGARTWNDLPYVTALAGDVYAWAKAATKPTYTADEIGNLSNYVNTRIPTDILKYSEQTLTDTQKTQARTNIGITDEQISSWDASTKTFIAEFSQPDTSTEVNMSTSLNDLKNAINNGYQVFAKFTRCGTTYMLPLAIYMVAASTTLARIAFSGVVNMAPKNNSEPKTTIMTLISSNGGSTWTWWNVHGTNKYDIQSLEETGLKNPNALTIKLGDTTVTYDGSAPQTVTIEDESDKDLSQSLLNKLFPIGYIYLSTVATNPKDLFGGTWEQLKDRFLLAAGDTYSAGATGGEATHKLTTAEMPSHTHSAAVNGGTVNYGKNRTTIGNFAINTEGYEDGSTIFPTGNGAAHNNMPPYLAVYMWKRTA